MSSFKKSSSPTPGGNKIAGLFSLMRKNPWITLGVVAALPVLILMGFTFKSGYSQRAANNGQKLILKKTPTELADQATALLQKRDTAGFIDFLDQELGNNINVVNSKGDPLLLVAATLGNLEAVQQIIMAGADVNKRNAFTKDTALLRSIYYTNNSEIAQLLLYSGADINAVNNYNHSPMYLALEKQRGDLVDLFLSSGVSEGLNAAYLLRASAKKNHMGVLAMLKGGIDPNISNEKGNTPLIISSSLGDLPSVRDLLAYRADTNAANKDGNTALIYAARYNHPKVVRELLKPQTMQLPIDINAQNKAGQTALFWAASKGNEEIVKRLLAEGADATIADNNGVVPYSVAVKNKRSAVLPWFEKSLLEVKNSVIKQDNEELLAQAKADGEELPDEQTATAAITDADIFKAAEKGDVELARKVIAQNKAVVFDKNKSGDSALIVAVENGHTDVVDFLVKNFARLSEASGKGNVFHVAVQTQNMDMLKHLVKLAREDGRLALMLEYKGNVAGQKQPLTPLGLAAENCNKEMYDYLISVGAKPGVRSTETNIMGIMSPVDRMAKCNAKPTEAKKLTSTTSKQTSSKKKRKK